MRPLYEMEIIQIDITNSCIKQCSNCTRFCGHHRKNFFMVLETFKKAVDSLVDFPGMVGMIGGEPLLHPEFEEMAWYLEGRIQDKERRGLWSTIPENKMKYAATIKRVFGNLYLNDHAVNTILHQPILVAAQEMVMDREKMWEFIDSCWVQTMWSASITPKGAFFCEVAAAMDMLFDGPGGWPIEPDWWKRWPNQFGYQKELWCPICGCAIPLQRRPSVDCMDDVSPGNLVRLKRIGSPRATRGRCHIYDRGFGENWNPDPNWYMSNVEEESEYRKRIAEKLQDNEDQEQTPYEQQQFL